MKPVQFAPVVLLASRVKLRLMEDRDALALFQLYSDTDVMQYWSHAAWSQLAQAELAIKEARAEYGAGVSIHYVIELLSSGEVIGSCALYAFGRAEGNASLGYLLAKSHWGKGYLSEAMWKFLDHAFGDRKLDLVRANINPDNAASAKALHRLGFLREGPGRENWVVEGRECPTHAFVMHRHRWLFYNANRTLQPNFCSVSLQLSRTLGDDE